MKSYALFGLCALGLILVSAFLLGLLFRGPGDASAIRLGALVALVVQVPAFGAVRSLAARPGGMMVGWGVGALVRLLTLVTFGILVVLTKAVAPAAALVALATFLFLTTLIEPLFLGR